MVLTRASRDGLEARATSPFFRQVTLTELTLRVRDLHLVADFYREVLGLREIAFPDGDVGLSPTGQPPALIVLRPAPTAPVAPAGAAGLFHAALLYPDRPALGRALARVIDAGLRVGGADHGVSEAVYLADPEGNGLELYQDRPPAEWPPTDVEGQVAMYSDSLDFQEVLRAGAAVAGPAMPAETRIGHVHLRVSDLDRAERFYAGGLGFPVRQRDYPGARFFARDGYHHHLGVNVWHSRRPTEPGALGLAGFTILFAPNAYFPIVDRLRIAKQIDRGVPGGVDVRDPDGIPIRLRPTGSTV